MYKQFYGLREIPFSLVPNPKYLFHTESLLEVLANLQYGIENGKGIVVVTGEVGTGKTTILRSMLQRLDRSVLAAYIFNPLLSTREFFDLLGSEFQMEPEESKAAILRGLGQLLMSRHQRGLRTILIVDEAHLLPRHLLEEIRLLSNFETNRDKLLQIIMCGQPELCDLLAQTELRQLKQRVSLKCSIQPLSESETAAYILWRLRIAGREEDLFDVEAIEMIHRYSGGIPRIVNNICDNALLDGFAEGSPRITQSIVRGVIHVLDLRQVNIATRTTDYSPLASMEAGAHSSHSAGTRIDTGLTDLNYMHIATTGIDGSRNFTIESAQQAQQDDPMARSRFFQRVRVTQAS